MDDGHMEGWKDGADKWMNGWWVDSWMDAQMDGYMKSDNHKSYLLAPSFFSAHFFKRWFSFSRTQPCLQCVAWVSGSRSDPCTPTGGSCPSPESNEDDCGRRQCRERSPDVRNVLLGAAVSYTGHVGLQILSGFSLSPGPVKERKNILRYKAVSTSRNPFLLISKFHSILCLVSRFFP